jgi:hypothetical protein
LLIEIPLIPVDGFAFDIKLTGLDGKTSPPMIAFCDFEKPFVSFA